MPAAHPRAHALVARAVLTGELVRPAVCSKCGQPPKGKGKIHAHHRDYEKPLEVEWLCPRCHRYAPPGINGGDKMPMTVRIPDDLRARLDAARGDVPRERFVRGLLDRALESVPGAAVAPDIEGSGGRVAPASSGTDSSAPPRPRPNAEDCPSCFRYHGPPKNGNPCGKCGAVRTRP